MTVIPIFVFCLYARNAFPLQYEEYGGSNMEKPMAVQSRGKLEPNMHSALT